MRFNVENAYWLSDRVREKILQMVSEDLYFALYAFFRKITRWT